MPGTDDYRIRPATAGDLDNLVALHLASLDQMASGAHALQRLRTGSFPTEDEVREVLAEALTSDEMFLAVAEHGDELAGMLAAIRESFGDELLAAPFLTVYHIATKPTHAGRGVAGALMQYLERLARNAGIGTIELLVWSTNATAIGLYEKLGYEVLEHRMAKRLD